MHIYTTILLLMLLIPVQAYSEEVPVTPRKSFFDFSKYVTIDAPTVDLDEDISKTEEVEPVIDLVEETKIKAAEEKSESLKALRVRRTEIFEQYSAEKQKVDEQSQLLSQQLSDNSTNTKKSFELNEKVSKLNVEKKRLLKKFRDESARLSKDMDELQGRNQVMVVDQPDESKIRPAKVKKDSALGRNLNNKDRRLRVRSQGVIVEGPFRF